MNRRIWLVSNDHGLTQQFHPHTTHAQLHGAVKVNLVGE